MPEGVIAGGWSYVTAAYAFSVVVLAVYSWQLIRASRRAKEEIRDDD